MGAALSCDGGPLANSAHDPRCARSSLHLAPQHPHPKIRTALDIFLLFALKTSCRMACRLIRGQNLGDVLLPLFDSLDVACWYVCNHL